MHSEDESWINTQFAPTICLIVAHFIAIWTDYSHSSRKREFSTILKQSFHSGPSSILTLIISPRWLGDSPFFLSDVLNRGSALVYFWYSGAKCTLLTGSIIFDIIVVRIWTISVSSLLNLLRSWPSLVKLVNKRYFETVWGATNIGIARSLIW